MSGFRLTLAGRERELALISALRPNSLLAPDPSSHFGQAAEEGNQTSHP